MRVSYGSGARLLLLATLCCGSLLAQTMQAPTGPGIATFRSEGILPFSQIGITTPPNIPQNVIGSIQAGALEIRQVITWAPPGSNINVRHILVQPGSPNPTPEGAQVQTVDSYEVSIREVIATEDTLTMIGSLSRVIGQSPFRLSSGVPVIYSFGYNTAETPATFRNSTLIVPGTISTFVANAAGTLEFRTPPGPGPGEGLQANAGPDFSSVVNEVVLDAVLSTIPPGASVSYSWRVVQGAANLLSPNTAQTRAQLAGNFGIYVFELTVTDSEGNTSSDQVRVTYTGRF